MRWFHEKHRPPREEAWIDEPRSIELLSTHPGFRRVTVEQGLGGTEPDSPPAYVAACFYTFDSIESFLAAFTPHAEELQGDMKHCTDIAPQIQFNEIHIAKASHQRHFCFPGRPLEDQLDKRPIVSLTLRWRNTPLHSSGITRAT